MIYHVFRTVDGAGYDTYMLRCQQQYVLMPLAPF